MKKLDSSITIAEFSPRKIISFYVRQQAEQDAMAQSGLADKVRFDQLDRVKQRDSRTSSANLDYFRQQVDIEQCAEQQADQLNAQGVSISNDDTGKLQTVMQDDHHLQTNQGNTLGN